MIYHVESAPGDHGTITYNTRGYIGACCGSYIACTWDEFVSCIQGICVYITDEVHLLPKDTDKNRYRLVKGEGNDLIYINEAVVPNYLNAYRVPHDRPKRDKVKKTPYCSVYIDTYLQSLKYKKTAVRCKNDAGDLAYYTDLSIRYMARWQNTKEKSASFQWVFVIISKEQSQQEGCQELLKTFGTKVYETDGFVANSNMTTINALKLFIFKR